MDVRCEKCQTEYELDEARLKPGGVTVKCTNCGHMFKIRKRTPTNAGVPTVQQVADSTRNKPPSPPADKGPARQARADSMLDEAVTSIAGEDGPTTVERQWLIRLENGDQKSCRELTILQQWIVTGVVTRESLISRTGKTWKRLGDIAELVQYFDISDEARTTREERRASPTNKPPPRDEAARGTMLGVGGPTAAGGTILPDDEEGRTTGNYQARPPTKPPPLPGPKSGQPGPGMQAAPGPAKVPTKTPPMGSNSNPPAGASPPPARRPLTTPPPPPPKKLTDPPSEASGLPSLRGGPPPGNRATAAWATDGADKVGAVGTTSASSSTSGPSGPYHGKLAAIPDEPAFAGKVRVSPPDEASFDTGRMRRDDDDEDLLPKRKGSSAGLLILFMVLIVGSGAAALVYYFVIREKPEQQVKTPADASLVAQTPDAAPIVTPVIDAGVVVVVSPLDAARAELATDNEARMRVSYDGLSGNDDPVALAIRANLGAALAQAFIDRATVSAEKAESERLRKDAKALALEAATAAQKALKSAPDDPGASVAMAHVLRLQGKAAKDIKRYVDAASMKPGMWARDLALANALVLSRDGKLADAKAAFAAIDSGDGKLETSNDVRARFHLALIALAEEKDTEAKPLVDQILVAQPEHAGAKALAAKLETRVAKTDPLPPEDPRNGSGGVGSGSGRPRDPVDRPDPPVTGDYDSLVRRADQLAQTSCVKAIEMYSKALEKKPNGVEALTGLGYCHLDAKNFASAHSRFRTALVISSRYEPALAGIAEAYQQQGRKEDAIAAWRRYLEAYPGSKKALAALDRLGASGTPPDPPTGSGSGSAEQPPPPPPPQPQPPQPGQPGGAGSGSG